jgi:hypothetical protein
MILLQYFLELLEHNIPVLCPIHLLMYHSHRQKVSQYMRVHSAIIFLIRTITA